LDRTEVVKWVLTVYGALRWSEAKTLVELVMRSVRVGRVSLPAIAAELPSPTSMKHSIKRVRFTANSRVEISTAMQGVIEQPTRRRREPLVVALGWVEEMFHDQKSRNGFALRNTRLQGDRRSHPASQESLSRSAHGDGVLHYVRNRAASANALSVLRPAADRDAELCARVHYQGRSIRKRSAHPRPPRFGSESPSRRHTMRACGSRSNLFDLHGKCHVAKRHRALVVAVH
jgi:hypothetical protein